MTAISTTWAASGVNVRETTLDTLLIIGAGAAGSVTAKKAALNRDVFKHIHLASRRIASCEAVAASAKSKIEVHQVDADHTDQVIALHTGARYTVQIIGFTPGFPYLAGLDPRLVTPRRGEPRTRVPAGSVGIGGEQTGIYPMATPGGWNIVGRTPLAIFD